MVKITVTGSSSSGNNYLIESGGEILIIELGMKFSEILGSLKYDIGLKKVVGCIVSHFHGDHFNKKTAESFISYGFLIYGNSELCERYPFCTEISKNSMKKIGRFEVRPFPLEHTAMNYGYCITCPTGERVVFATDCNSIPYDFRNGAEIFLVEANHDEAMIEKSIIEGEDVTSVFQSHMDIEDTVEFLNRNFSGKAKKVILIHLSARYSDEKLYIEKVKKETPFTDVSAAHKGDVFNIYDDFDYGE